MPEIPRVRDRVRASYPARGAPHSAKGLRMPLWAWILIIVLLVLLIGGGYGYRGRG